MNPGFCAHLRRLVLKFVLDMDSSGNPRCGEQEGSACNGHFGCTCYHPLFVFNQAILGLAISPAAKRR
jgi:Transposase DDE domain group 1